MSAFVRVKDKEPMQDEVIQRLTDENARLREELRALKVQQQGGHRVAAVHKQPASPAEYAKPAVKYHMSNHVIVVGKEGKADRVPLLKLLVDSRNRIDNREADTPIAGSLGPVQQEEERVRREILTEALKAGEFDDAEDEEPTSTANTSSPSAPPRNEEPHPKEAGAVDGTAATAAATAEGKEKEKKEKEGKRSGTGAPGPRRRPAPLSKGALNMAGHNGIISKQSLNVFQENWGSSEAARSPHVSIVADSILEYLSNGFAAQGFTHTQRPGALDAFGRHVIALCGEVCQLLKQEPLQLTLQSPIYVFGDIHGNFRDLHYFISELTLFKNLKYTPHNFLFLGDYVDRGPYSVECVALLFALKVLSPSSLFLLRGNHEDRLVNGDVRTYGNGSLKAQCHQSFGAILGESVWAAINGTFKWLPLTATIDNTIFCTHGGIPRYSGGKDDRMERMRDTFHFPRFETFFECGPGEPAHIQACRQTAADICWSDPCEGEEELDAHGFGANPRGQGIVVFGSKAVDEFLANHGFQYIFRAHQEKSDGLKVSKNARVLTIFSTSDYIGHQNGAGVVFVSHTGTIRMIIKAAKDEPVLPPGDVAEKKKGQHADPSNANNAKPATTPQARDKEENEQEAGQQLEKEAC